MNIGDQTRHRQLAQRLTEICENKNKFKSASVDDYDF